MTSSCLCCQNDGFELSQVVLLKIKYRFEEESGNIFEGQS